MSSFRNILKWEWRSLLADKYLLAVLVLAPLWIVCLLSFSVTTDIRGSRMAVADGSHDAMTANIVGRFQSNPYFTVVGEVGGIDEIEARMRRGDIDIALVFGQEYAESVGHLGEANIQIVVDGSDNQAMMRASYAQRLLAEYQKEAMQSGGTRPVFMIVPETKLLYNPYQRGDLNVLPGGISLIMFVICTIMGCIAFSRFPLKGEPVWLLQPSLAAKNIVLAKSVPYITLAAVALLLALVVAGFLHIAAPARLAVVFGTGLIYIVAGVFLGQFIGIAADEQFTGQIIAGMVVFGVSILLSGFIFPIETMPDWLQYLAAVIPAKWNTDLLKKLIVQCVPLKYALKEIAVLGLFAVLFLVAAVGRFSKIHKQINPSI